MDLTIGRLSNNCLLNGPPKKNYEFTECKGRDKMFCLRKICLKILNFLSRCKWK